MFLEWNPIIINTPLTLHLSAEQDPEFLLPLDHEQQVRARHRDRHHDEHDFDDDRPLRDVGGAHRHHRQVQHRLHVDLRLRGRPQAHRLQLVLLQDSLECL